MPVQPTPVACSMIPCDEEEEEMYLDVYQKQINICESCPWPVLEMARDMDLRTNGMTVSHSVPGRGTGSPHMTARRRVY